MKKNMKKIADMMLLNAAMGAAMSVEEAKLISRYLGAKD